MPVDISEVLTLTRAATRTLDATGDTLKGILDRAAQEERRTHVYRNITHRLENSTFALGPLDASDNTVTVEYGARMDYASFVQDRGRSNVSEIGERAVDVITFQFDALADALGRL